ncbi:MAG: ATP-binding protein [Bacillota bacterium]|nr:ATP-binding protein [Bacillota bacterium]
MTAKRLLLLLCILFSLVITSSCSSSKMIKTYPKVNNGVIDLTNWDFDRAGSVKLDGQWEFYWNSLLKTEDFNAVSAAKKKQLEPVPGLWNEYDNGKAYTVDGYATYRIKIKTNNNYDNYALELPYACTSYDVWVNGKLATTTGVVGKSKVESVPLIIEKFIPVKSENGEIELVFHVSNYVRRESGLAYSIVLGTEQQIMEKKARMLALDMFIFGALLIMGIYYIGIYALRRKDKSTLFFGLFCLIMSLRTIIFGERYIEGLFVNFNWVVYTKLGYISFYSVIPIIVSFIASLYPKETPKHFVKISKRLGIIFSLIVLVTPHKIYDIGMIPYVIITAISFIIIFGILVAAIKNRELGAVGILTSFFIFSLTVINDFLYDRAVVEIGFLTPVGLFIMVIAQALIISVKFSNAFKTVEALSARLLSFDKLKDEFLANTSHELRTPLNGIVGIAESMLDGAAGKISDIQRNNLSLIVSSGKRLASLVNDILDFSKIKNTGIVLEKKKVDVRQIVEVILAICTNLSTKGNLKLVNNVPVDEMFIYADESRFQQIVYNLIGNAVKFTEEGNIEINAKQDKDFIELYVSDSGIGIPEDKLQDIFKSFEQIDSSAARKYSGTGLGLSITKSLVELHGGSISVKSELGKGSVFVVSMPAYRGHSDKNTIEEEVNTKLLHDFNESENALVEETEVTYEKDNTNEKFKILVVDDEAVNIRVLTNHLTNQGYQVITAASGTEALKIIEGCKDISLVILDVMMPYMTGYEVCSILRETYSLFELPILMLTARNLPENIITGFDMGANDYLEKPFNKSELLARIKNLLTLQYAVKEALVNVKKYKSEREKTIFLEALRDLNRELTSIFRIEDIFSRFFNNLKKVIKYNKALVLLKQGSSFEILINKGYEELNEEYLLSNPLIKKVKNMFEPMVLNPQEKIGHCNGSILAIPITYREEIYGIVILENFEDDFYEISEREIALTFAGQAGIALKNANLFQELSSKKESFKSLLDNVGQGLLSFGSDLIIDEEYSYECLNIFEEEIQRKFFPKIITKDAVTRNFLKKIIPDIIQETNEFRRESLIELLPRETNIKGKCIKLQYKLIKGLTKDKSTNIMVLLTDITDKRELQSKIEKERNTLKMIVKTIVNQNDFMKTISDYKIFCEIEAVSIINSKDSIENILSRLLVEIHTYKGVFSQLEVINISKYLHEFEDEIINSKDNLYLMDIPRLKEMFSSSKLLGWLQEDLDILRKSLGERFFENDNFLIVQEEKIIKLEEMVTELLEGRERELILIQLRQLRYKPFKELLKLYPQYTMRLAEKLNKSINPIKINGGEFLVDIRKYHKLEKSLIHVFRNAIDHGIELPQQRLKKGKSEYGEISCSVNKDEDNIYIIIKDDGQGLDFDKLADIVKDRKMTIDNNVTEIIFRNGISTKKEATEVSGRGAGLSAVKEQVEQLNGTIKVRSELHKGTSFEITIPCLE